MPRQAEEKLRRIHLWIFDSDAEKIKDIFGKTVGESKAIRLMIRSYLKLLEAKAQENARSIAPSNAADELLASGADELLSLAPESGQAHEPG